MQITSSRRKRKRRRRRRETENSETEIEIADCIRELLVNNVHTSSQTRAHRLRLAQGQTDKSDITVLTPDHDDPRPKQSVKCVALKNIPVSKDTDACLLRADTDIRHTGIKVALRKCDVCCLLGNRTRQNKPEAEIWARSYR